MCADRSASMRYDVSPITDHDIYLFKEGRHCRLYEKLGSRCMRAGDTPGTFFAVWAPNARGVSVIGDFNGWDATAHPLHGRQDSSGIWEGFVPGVGHGTRYKYHIVSQYRGYAVDKSDPFARCWEGPPRTASIVWETNYSWGDADWMAQRRDRNTLQSPVSAYEVHLGSWRRVPEEDNRPLTYRETAFHLTPYVQGLGFTHVEFLPVMEHPFYGSWGYQTLGYFAPTSRYGTPEDFMHLVDQLHRQGIGVILDWVPSHFPNDEHGLVYFDGTYLFEHADPKKGYHPDWNTYIFNHGRYEVRSFLLSSATFWLDVMHADGLRVDAVASMLYLDYSRAAGEWIPNTYGGNENLEAISFVRAFNESVYRDHPDTMTVAEESTAWPMVTRPVHVGGLGFGLKWNMGWMHDVLDYMSKDPIFRKYHHNELTFSIMYAFAENFMLSLSHDEVVHGKGSLLGKMPGDAWQQFANLRLLLGYLFMHPGKKLLFMGAEIGQRREWYHEESLDWHVLEHESHRGVQAWVRDLNQFYRAEPALHAADCEPAGFAWIDCTDWEKSVLSFTRQAPGHEGTILVVCNFTPEPRVNYRLGVPRSGFWAEALNSDAPLYGGSGWGNMGGREATPIAMHGHSQSVVLELPPLSVSVFRNC